MGASETYDIIPGVYAGTSLGVCLGSSDPSVGTPSINHKRVWDQSVSVFTAAADSRWHVQVVGGLPTPTSAV